MSTAININACSCYALTFLFLWTTTGLVLKSAMHYMLLCVSVYIHIDDITIARMESTWTPVCVTFALVNIAYLERIFVGLTSLSHRSSPPGGVSDTSHQPPLTQKQMKLWKDDESLHIWWVDIRFPPRIILEKRANIQTHVVPCGAETQTQRSFYPMKSNTWMQISCKRPTVQREIPQENLLKYPLFLEKDHPVGWIAAVGIGSWTVQWKHS